MSLSSRQVIASKRSQVEHLLGKKQQGRVLERAGSRRGSVTVAIVFAHWAGTASPPEPTAEPKGSR